MEPRRGMQKTSLIKPSQSQTLESRHPWDGRAFWGFNNLPNLTRWSNVRRRLAFLIYSVYYLSSKEQLTRTFF